MTYQLITIVGNVGKDAEIRYLRDGIAVCDFTVAVNKVTGRGDNRVEKTTWFKVTLWRERAETASNLVKKGTKILVTGEIDASAYIDKKTNEPRASLEITASEFRLLSSRGEGQGDEGGGYAPVANNRGNNNQRGNQQTDEEDIPF